MYVKHAACHWLVNFALELAQHVEPNRAWRIITSQEHSTVWDGKDTLFDFNFLALGVTAARNASGWLTRRSWLPVAILKCISPIIGLRNCHRSRPPLASTLPSLRPQGD
jgi:hypothetical protein